MIFFPWSTKNAWILGGFEYLNADNVTADAGAGGATFRSDDIGSGVQVPYAKLMDGTDGSGAVIPGDATNGLFVNVKAAALPTGASTEATLAAASAKLPATLGQKAMAASMAVTLASDQASVPVAATLTAETTKVIGTINVAAAQTIATTNAGTFAVQATLAAGAAAIAKAEDVASANADVGVPAMAVQKATPANTAGTDGDYEFLQMAAGRLWVDPSGVTLTVGSHAVTDGGGSFTVDSPQLPASLGQKAMTASLPVVLASDQTSMPVTNAGTFATQVDGAALTALQLIDDVVFAEDVAAQAGDKGVQILAVRRDANTTLVGADNDYAPLQVNADGSLKVAITAGAGSGGTSAADDSAFSVGSGSGTPIMGLADEGSPDSVDEGDVGIVRMTLPRALHVNLRDASGAEVSVGGGTQYNEDTAHTTGDKMTMAGVVRRDANTSLVDTDGDVAPLQVNAAGALKVDATTGTLTVAAHAVTNAGTFAVQATLAAGAAAIAKAEDVASADADVGVPAMAVRKATPANTSGTDGDYEMLQMSAGRLWVDPSGVTLTVASHAVTNAGTFAVQAGQAAHDAAVSGNPVRIAGRAGTSAYTAVADGDTADLLTTVLGKLVVMPYCLPGSAWKYVGAAGGIVTTTAITIKAAAGAGIINYITSITLVNSHQTIGTEVVINDGAAGTAIFRTWCQFAGGGCSIKCDPPLASSANTLLEIKEVTTTGTAGIVAQIIGYSAAE